MNISQYLSQREFQNIMMNIYQKIEQFEHMETREFIAELKMQLLAASNTGKKPMVDK